MTDLIIQTRNLRFGYQAGRNILHNISLNIPRGAIYGFLGPNGAGKSTTMRLLTGIIQDDNNSISIFNRPLSEQMPEIFTRIGSLVESPALYLHLSGLDNVRYLAAIRHVSKQRVNEVMELVGLTRDAKRKVRQYSLGMKQRLAIAMALLDEPELLLLDEPVNGLDPSGISEIRQLLVKLNRENNVTIFISSHLLSEIEKMCTHIGIIDHGHLKFEGTIDELSKRYSKCRVQVHVQDAFAAEILLRGSYPSIRASTDEKLELEFAEKAHIPGFIEDAIFKGIGLYEVKINDGLEDWFMNLTSPPSPPIEAEKIIYT